jgi:hypothetical protein
VCASLAAACIDARGSGALAMSGARRTNQAPCWLGSRAAIEKDRLASGSGARGCCARLLLSLPPTGAWPADVENIAHKAGAGGRREALLWG